MRYLLSIIVILLAIPSLISQNNDYFKIKDVRIYRFDHLLLDNEKDITAFIQTASEYNYIEALKVSNTAQLDKLLSNLGKCYGVRELNLTDYRGEFTEHTFDSAQEIEVLHLTISEEKLDQLKHLGELRKLNVLYIYILGKPENTEALKNLPQLKELHIIGDFLPDDLSAIFQQVRNQRLLNVFGISLDRITDLLQEIVKYRFLSRLNLYDNLSVFTNKGIDDLNEEKLSIVFDLYSDAISAIAISYFSNTGNLSDFEIEFLQKTYKGEIMPQQFASEEQPAEEGANIPFKKEFKPDFPKTSEFHSPYTSIHPKEEYFLIDPNKNNILYSQSGMKLVIAANSFENDRGENIQEPVYIKLLQCITPVELLFTGINLSQGSQQYSNKFLFNIQASAEKNFARLKNGYQIKVSIPSSQDSSKAHFFDYESNSFQDLSFYNQVFENNFVPIDFYKLENSGSTNSVYLFDTSSFDTRYLSSHATFLSDNDIFSQMVFKKKAYYTDLDRTWSREYNSTGRMKGFKIKKGKSLIKIQKVIPKVRNKTRQYFKLIDRSGISLFPELEAFRNINFNVEVNPENKREFNDNYIKNIKYLDFRIRYTKGQDYCEIQLKTSDGYRKIKAYLTDTEDKELIKKQIRKFEKAFVRFIRIQDKRKTEFNALNEIRFGEFKTYTTRKIKDFEKNGQYFDLKVHQLGTFAYFYPCSPEFNTALIAQYTDLKGLPIDIKDIYMIDSRYNTLFKINVGNVSLNPTYCAYIIATDYSGNLYYANKDDIAASQLSNNSLIYIKMKRVPSNITSIYAFMNLVKN